MDGVSEPLGSPGRRWKRRSCILEVREREGAVGGGVEDRSVTLSRQPILPDGGSGSCCPRVRREHRQTVTSVEQTGS